jgi:hypothetical protein
VTSIVRARSTGSRRPLYARLLRLRYLHPGGVACFLLLEGTFALGALLALAELVAWPVVLLLPIGVAVMVKLNDVVAGTALHRLGQGRAARVARGTAVVADRGPAPRVPANDRAIGTAPAPGRLAPDRSAPNRSASNRSAAEQPAAE